MTDAKTTTIPTSSLDPDVTAGVAQFLSPVVVNLQALAVDGKQAHWHVRGANFIGVHEFLDTLVSHAQEWADLAAERIVALGLPVDARDYTHAAQILRDLGVDRVRLLSNNPAKVSALTSLGVEVSERVPLAVGVTTENLRYLRTKRDRMGHDLPWLPETDEGSTT